MVVADAVQQLALFKVPCAHGCIIARSLFFACCEETSIAGACNRADTPVMSLEICVGVGSDRFYYNDVALRPKQVHVRRVHNYAGGAARIETN